MTEKKAIEFVEELVRNRVQVSLNFDTPPTLERVLPIGVETNQCIVTMSGWFEGTLINFKDNDDPMELMEFMAYLRDGNIRLVAK